MRLIFKYILKSQLSVRLFQMYSGHANTAGTLTPKGRGRTVAVESIFVLHLTLHYTEECLFALLLKRSHITSNAVAMGRLTENRNSVGKPGAPLGAVRASR